MRRLNPSQGRIDLVPFKVLGTPSGTGGHGSESHSSVTLSTVGEPSGDPRDKREGKGKV